MNKPQNQIRRACEAGFTLVEIMVVVVIIGMLATLVATNVDLLFGDANVSKAQSDTKSIYSAAQQFKMSKRRIPTIEDLTTPDSKGRAYLESLSDDPWGQPYVIEELEGGRFRVLSYGEDLAEGTEDDIVYPAPDEEG